VRLQDVFGDRSPVAFRLAAAFLGGSAAALAAVVHHRPHYAPAVGWITAAVVYLGWTWAAIRRMGSEETREHALHNERDGTRHLAHTILVAASLTSLAGVAILLYATAGQRPDLAAGIVGVLSVVSSWITIHTVYTLRYARLYYSAPDSQRPGMDFEGEPPSYLDFAYVAFTIGMCYSVPDNGLTNRKVRMSVLSQGMLSYMFGTIIIATTLNLISGLAG
jgi:uncharacterized membrane protein